MIPNDWQLGDEVVIVEQTKALVHLPDQVLDFSGAFLAGGQIGIQRIDNGFLLHVTTVTQQPVTTPFTPPFVGTARILFCATVKDVMTAIGDLLQLPWRAEHTLTPPTPEEEPHG